MKTPTLRWTRKPYKTVRKMARNFFETPFLALFFCKYSIKGLNKKGTSHVAAHRWRNALQRLPSAETGHKNCWWQRMPKKTLLDMSDTSREEKTLTLSARTSGKETQAKKNDSILCFFMWKMLVAKMSEENTKRWKGGQDMPDFETSREEKTLTFSARTSARETQQKKGQHFVFLCMFK